MYSQEETKEMRSRISMELMRYKILSMMASNCTPQLYIEDVNELMIVAGLPVIVPDEVNKKELEVM